MPRQERLTVEQYVQVVDWLRTNKERLARLGSSQQDACDLASAELGYRVPRSSVKKCAEIAGIVWPGSPKPEAPVPIEREAIIIMLGALEGIYIETGRTVPGALATLKRQYVGKQTIAKSVKEGHCDNPTE